MILCDLTCIFLMLLVFCCTVMKKKLKSIFSLFGYFLEGVGFLKSISSNWQRPQFGSNNTFLRHKSMTTFN